MFRWTIASGLIFGIHSAAGAAVIRIADGDCSEFQDAVSLAARGPVVLSLARNGNYISRSSDVDGIVVCGASLKTGSLTIEGNGATIVDAHSLGIGSMFSVAAGASLQVRNLRVVDETTTDLAVPSARFTNSGNLSFENVTFAGNGWTVALSGVSGSSATFRNTTWTKAAFEGSFDAYNSTFVDSNISPRSGDKVRLSNSLLAITSHATDPSAQSPRICSLAAGDRIISLGGNVATDSSCGLAGEGDKVVSNLGVPAAAYHGGLVPTVQIGYGHPAYRAGVAQYCEATDARGVTRNAANCDAGAYESGGGLGLVTENGMNGLYYVPGIGNGHYVSVQRIHDNQDVLVFWNTFDRNGNQAWIYGVGMLTSDRHIRAQMARNTGGVLQPGGPATGSTSSTWGTVDIDVTNCDGAQFSYQSPLPEFGSGQFALTRLAFESAVNCGD